MKSGCSIAGGQLQRAGACLNASRTGSTRKANVIGRWRVALPLALPHLPRCRQARLRTSARADSTTRSKTRRKMPLSRKRSLRAREKADWSEIEPLQPQFTEPPIGQVDLDLPGKAVARVGKDTLSSVSVGHARRHRRGRPMRGPPLGRALRRLQAVGQWLRIGRGRPPRVPRDQGRHRHAG
jgi:hypothetical protein